MISWLKNNLAIKNSDVHISVQKQDHRSAI